MGNLLLLETEWTSVSLRNLWGLQFWGTPHYGPLQILTVRIHERPFCGFGMEGEG